MNQLDPKSIWLFFISFIVRFIFLIIILSFFMVDVFLDSWRLSKSVFSGLFFIPLGVLLLFVVFSYVWARLSYHYYRYELREDGFRKEHGVIWKKYVTIPYDRIQNVDIYRGLIARLLGLSDLHVQTAGMSMGGQYGGVTEGRLPGLSLQVAEGLRDELVKRARQSRNQGI